MFCFGFSGVKLSYSLHSFPASLKFDTGLNLPRRLDSVLVLMRSTQLHLGGAVIIEPFHPRGSS